MIVWSPRKPEDGPAIYIAVDGDKPWNRLSSDYQHGQIPVPGLHGMTSESVTGIMEGLKLIGWTGKRGKINPAYFLGPGRQRPLKKEEEREEWLLGWSYEGRCLNLPDARHRIQIPAYLWMVQNKCHGLIAKLRSMSRKYEEEGATLTIYDDGWHAQVDDFEQGFSLASVLVAYLVGNLDNFERELTLQ